MAETMADKLNERFAAGGQTLEPDVVVQLQSIMNMHGLPVEELFYKWEAYCIKMDLDAGGMNMERLRAFKQDLQDALERRNQEPTLHPHKKVKTEGRRLAATPRNAAKQNDVFGLLDNLVPGTPKTTASSSAAKKTPSSRLRNEPAGSSPDAKTPSRLADKFSALGVPPSSFNDRQNAGEILEVLNQQLPAPEPPIVPYAEPRVKLTAASDQKKLSYKPLAMKLSEASEILDDRIDEFTTLIMEHHKLDYEALGSAARQGTDEIVAVGRIASDAPEGKLNAASVVLETARRTGGGLRVPLDLGRLRGYQFFPGQIVALRGTNSTGHSFAVREILEMPLLPNAASSVATLAAHRDKMRGGSSPDDDMDMDGSGGSDPAPLNVLFASGPYTADDNLDFEPLHALCSLAADKAVDVVVLVGPFLDADHPLIATGDFDLPEEAGTSEAAADNASMTTAFRYMVTPALQRLVTANPAVTVVLVPSVRDVLDRHVSWPQEAFPRRELGLPKAVRIVGNPMTLSINEAVLGVSAQDVLYELRHEEVAGGQMAEPNAIARACHYIIEQRHYFPLFPPADRRRLPRTGVADTEGMATGAMLDTSYLKLGEMVNVRPDILLIPSALPPFARVIESVLVINPGYLSKRRGPGTYASMALYPPPAAPSNVRVRDEDEEEMVAHGVFSRARVEITRI